MASETSPRGGHPACCPLPPGVAPLAVTPDSYDDEGLTQLGRWAHALSDPIRLRILDVIVRAQDCCRPGDEAEVAAPSPPRPSGGEGAAASRRAPPAGVCVCELQSLQGLAQSKVSYHLKILREAGLVREQRRGKWSFYAVDGTVAADFAAAVRRQLGL